MAIADRHGLPIACSIASASPHETNLVEATIEQRFTRAKPKRMIGDRAYDCDPLDQRLLQKHRIRLIAQHKYNRRRKNTQDGRELRRYCRRWKIGVSRQGHINQSVKVRPRPEDSRLVAWEAPWRESKAAKPSDNILGKEYAQRTRLQLTVNADVA